MERVIVNSKLYLIALLSIFVPANICYSKNLTNKTNQFISKINNKFAEKLLLVDKLQCCINENEKII